MTTFCIAFYQLNHSTLPPFYKVFLREYFELKSPTLREKESLLSVTYNLVLGNLCFANLLSAVLVKSISIVHHGHAIAANSSESVSENCLFL
jgi:hypothetical protein